MTEKIQQIYGVHACLACMKNTKRQILKIICSNNMFKKYNQDISQFTYQILSNEQLSNKFKKFNHQGIIINAISRYTNFNTSNFENFSKIAILDKLNDPHNIGAIMRSATAFGIEAIILPKRNCPIDSSVINHIASGAEEYLHIAVATNLTQTVKCLQQIGFWIAGTDAHANNNIDILKNYKQNKLAIVFGSEGKGISTLLKQNCDFLYKIPMNNSQINSINVSNSAAISFFMMS